MYAMSMSVPHTGVQVESGAVGHDSFRNLLGKALVAQGKGGVVAGKPSPLMDRSSQGHLKYL